MLLDGLVLTAFALGMFALSGLAWTGRWRDWSRNTYGSDLPLYMLPSMGFSMLLAVVADRVQLPIVFWAVAVIVLMCGFVLSMSGLFWRLPRWAVPRWLRPYYRKFPPWGSGQAAGGSDS